MSLDWITIALYVVLLFWGWFSVCGACYDYNKPDLFSFDLNSGKQFVWILTSLILAGALLLIEKRFYYQTTTFIYIMVFLILLITIFVAPDTKGSRSWIPIGPVKLQPAEFAKFAVALAVGKYMEQYGFTLTRFKDFYRVVLIFVLPMLLIVAQKETGTALVYLAFFLVLYREGMTGSVLFAAFMFVVYVVVGVKFSDEEVTNMPVSVGEACVLLLSLLSTIFLVWRYCKDNSIVKNLLLFGVGTVVLAYLFSAFVIPFNFCIVQLVVNFGVVVYLAIQYAYTKSYKYLLIILFAIASTGVYYGCHYVFSHKILPKHQQTRIEVLLGKNNDLQNAGYNVNQAKIAIGSGGFFGKGFLKGTQTKLKYVPEQETDFIFCTIGEEEGFVGSAGVLLCFLFLIWRLIILAERQPDTWGRVYGYSVVCIFLFHVFVNVGMVLGLTPVIGIPLPFFSYGGSSLWGFTILLFIFLRMDAERNFKSK